MRHLVNGTIAATAGLLLVVTAPCADACPTLNLTTRIDAATCCERLGPGGEQIYANPAFVVRGMLRIIPHPKGLPPPVLANLAVEVQTRPDKEWTTQARLVLNEYGAGSVETCRGALSQTAPDGRLMLVDEASRTISFQQAQALTTGKNYIRFVGVFRGPLPPFEFVAEPGRSKRTRIRTFATLIGGRANALCSVDADGDGLVETQVSTLLKARYRRIEEHGLPIE